MVSRNQLRQISHVKNVKHLEDNKWLFEVNSDIRAEIARYAQNNSLLILTMRVEEKSMEDVFKELTRG